MFKDNILQGKKILVTGGGTGLGKEMSEHYIQHGADVVICGRRESVLAETAEEFKEKYKDSGNWKHEMSQALLNELGQDGWELASQNSANEIYLKRQI